MDGKEATIQVKKHYPKIHIIILSMYTDNDFIVDLIEHGASGFLSKDSELKQVINAIKTTHECGYYFDAKVNKALVGGLVRRKKIIPAYKVTDTVFTPRELTILNSICKEKTSIEIGEELGISPRTVDGHRDAMLGKTG
jgi:DNA-binding NarL/FixJ family response regulator